MNSIELPVIIMIHGFGQKRSHDFDLLVTAFNNEYEVVTFDLYDLDDAYPNQTAWVRKADKVMQQYQDRVVYLLGFSMGGVIAGYLAARYAVDRLILVAPAFKYLSVSAWWRSVKQFKDPQTMVNRFERLMPLSYVSEFQLLINAYRPWIKYVQCPVLLIHARGDEVIDISSSQYALRHLPHIPTVLWLNQGCHEVLLDDYYQMIIVHQIKDFIGKVE
jgi:pimeloyl-ACP methyl ester carboxylesterase